MVLFRTSGVRGLYGKTITPELALKLGSSAGLLYSRIVVAHDHRLTSPLLADAFCSGAASAGAKVILGGFMPTPVLAWATKNHAEAGCMITASHNPPEYNGFKFINQDGSGFSKLQEKEIEENLSAKGDKTGSIEKSDSFLDEYVGAVRKRISKLDLKVVINSNHGAACAIAPRLLRELGCDVVELNSKPDWKYKPPEAEKIPELGDWTKIADLKATAKAVLEGKAEAGFIFDGDADRVFLIGKDGSAVSGDDLMAALSSLARGEVISVVDASLSISKSAGSVHLVPVGDVYVSNALRERKASFGGEACSGTFFWPDLHLTPDGLYSAAKIVEMIQNQDLYFKLREVSSSPIARERINCRDNFSLMRKIFPRVKELKPVSILSLDGVRAEWEDRWFLIRPSGTEPVVRITAQGETREKTGEALRTAVRIVTEESADESINT